MRHEKELDYDEFGNPLGKGFDLGGGDEDRFFSMFPVQTGTDTNGISLSRQSANAVSRWISGIQGAAGDVPWMRRCLKPIHNCGLSPAST